MKRKKRVKREDNEVEKFFLFVDTLLVFRIVFVFFLKWLCFWSDSGICYGEIVFVEWFFFV